MFKPSKDTFLSPPILVIHCSEPAISNNTQQLSLTKPLYEYQEWLRYACHVGYELVQGDLKRKCQADTTWSGRNPLCHS